ncbi:hypothetical protein GALMADRAFT_1362524 [Galerina marginata CBS 339.88]|uniref:Peptidase C14 caspase domain-containing protein n=1 Tax=Galerina marginata (strain CBS 339.88) TaxID=685588 RepID=A0A067S4V0_GALM3|nr:hypothetical protein GALMADRAFT_1362524 [Galerina marginata CBS 339.88]
MRPLEETEKSLWSAYEMVGTLDSDELMKICRQKVRTLDRDGLPNVEQKNLERLDKLDRLRLEKYRLIRKLRLPRDVPGEYITSDSSTQAFPRSRFWAVIIGVDDYYSIRASKLNGCVSDALLVYEFLTSDLGVAPSHIRLLLGPRSQAETQLPLNVEVLVPTRANILDALYQHLHDNPDICQGDNILIHFSGHGSRYPASD